MISLFLRTAILDIAVDRCFSKLFGNFVDVDRTVQVLMIFDNSSLWSVFYGDFVIEKITYWPLGQVYYELVGSFQLMHISWDDYEVYDSYDIQNYGFDEYEFLRKT